MTSCAYSSWRKMTCSPSLANYLANSIDNRFGLVDLYIVTAPLTGQNPLMLSRV
jgi:hypothetical protein